MLAGMLATQVNIHAIIAMIERENTQQQGVRQRASFALWEQLQHAHHAVVALPESMVPLLSGRIAGVTHAMLGLIALGRARLHAHNAKQVPFLLKVEQHVQHAHQENTRQLLVLQMIACNAILALIPLPKPRHA